jgi:glycerophosphoryl diester phosphodiesterase
MERILHRANTAAQISLAQEHGMDRLEVDLHARRKQFVISHDPPIGPLVLGKNGVSHSRKPWLLIRWGAPYLSFRDLLAQRLPLYLDLKGNWSDRALADLALQLRIWRHGMDDIVASLNWDLIDRFRAIDPISRVFYTAAHQHQHQAFTEYAFIQRVAENGITGITGRFTSFAACRVLLRYSKVLQKTHGLELFFWDVPNEDALSTLRHLQVKGAIIDNPALR